MARGARAVGVESPQPCPLWLPPPLHRPLDPVGRALPVVVVAVVVPVLAQVQLVVRVQVQVRV